MAKANGVRIADCDADAFAKQLGLVLMTMPAMLRNGTAYRGIAETKTDDSTKGVEK